MKQLLSLLSPLLHSHLLGFLAALLAFQAAVDVSFTAARIPIQLGFRRQGELLGATPILCAIGCLAVFLCASAGNRSRQKFIRMLGKIPVLGRYFVFVGVTCGLVFLEVQLLKFVTSSSIESLTLSQSISDEAWLSVQRQVGEGVTVRWAGDETRVSFLKGKRSAVLRALQEEHVLDGQ